MNWKRLLNSKPFLLILLLIFGATSYFFFQELRQRYKVEKDISYLKNQIYELEKGNRELNDLIEYFRSTSYQEKEIRQKLNLQKPGEHVVVLPDENVAIKVSEEAHQKTTAQENRVAWWNYFFSQSKN